jgi:soluble cytochrome b562
MNENEGEEKLENQIEEPAEQPAGERPIPSALPSQPAKAESRLRRFLRQLVRWTLGVLILLGIGFVAALLLLYMPLRRQADARAAELSAAQTRIESLEAQLAEKAQLEKLYQQSLERLKSADFQNNVLRLEMEIASARIYLYEGKLELAKTAMQNAQTILKAVQSGASSAQRTALTEMETRLTLALNGLEKDTYAAQSDLDVLARSLSEFSASLTASSP